MCLVVLSQHRLYSAGNREGEGGESRGGVGNPSVLDTYFRLSEVEGGVLLTMHGSRVV